MNAYFAPKQNKRMRKRTMCEQNWLQIRKSRELQLFKYLASFPGLIAECQKLCDYGITLDIFERCFYCQNELKKRNENNNQPMTLNDFKNIINIQTYPNKQQNAIFKFFNKIEHFKKCCVV